MATLEEDAWKQVERWAEEEGSSFDRCLLDLRRRVEALEQQRAATEESSATEPSSMSNASAGLQKIQEKMQEEGRILASLFDKALESSKAAPAADRPLWKVIRGAYASVRPLSVAEGYAAEIDAVADWLANTGPAFCTAAALLRAEAQATREGYRG